MSSTLPGHWWLAIDRKPEGPYGTEYVKALLMGGRIRADQPACRVGETAWTPLSSFPDFRSSANVPPPLPATAGPISLWDRLLACVGWYFLVASPAVLAVTWLTERLIPSDFAAGSRAHFQTAVVLWISAAFELGYVFFGCIAGHVLLNRQKRAVVWATIIILVGWAETVVVIGLLVLIDAAATPDMYRPGLEAGLDSLQLAVAISQLVLILGCFLFQIAALVVMWRSYPQLIDQAASK